MSATKKPKLNSREEAILSDLQKSISHEAICKKMRITERTLNFYLKSLLLKYECHTINALEEKIKEKAPI